MARKNVRRRIRGPKRAEWKKVEKESVLAWHWLGSDCRLRLRGARARGISTRPGRVITPGTILEVPKMTSPNNTTDKLVGYFAWSQPRTFKRRAILCRVRLSGDIWAGWARYGREYCAQRRECIWMVDVRPIIKRLLNDEIDRIIGDTTAEEYGERLRKHGVAEFRAMMARGKPHRDKESLNRISEIIHAATLAEGLRRKKYIRAWGVAAEHHAHKPDGTRLRKMLKDEAKKAAAAGAVVRPTPRRKK